MHLNQVSCKIRVLELKQDNATRAKDDRDGFFHQIQRILIYMHHIKQKHKKNLSMQKCFISQIDCLLIEQLQET